MAAIIWGDKAILLLSLTVIIFSCKKQGSQELTGTSTPSDAYKLTANLSTPTAPIPAPVDGGLLQKYIDYQQTLGKAAMLAKSGLRPVLRPTMTMAEFNVMIDNYLVNDANQLRQNDFIKNSQGFGGGAVTNNKDTIITLTEVVVCSGAFTSPNTLGTILFQSNVLPSNTLANSTFAFSGFAGSMTVTGGLIQSTSQGVITYRQNYQNVYSYLGVTYTQLFAIYGNVYHGACTVQGMTIIATPTAN